MKLLRWEYKVSLVMLFVCLLALIIILAEWWYAVNAREKILQSLNQQDVVDYQVDPLPEYTFLQHPEDFYVEMVSRPLFIQGRKPIVIDDAEEEIIIEQPTKPFTLALIGSLNTPNAGIVALFKDPKAKQNSDKFIRLAEGEDHFGWSVKSIAGDKVVMVSKGKEKEIFLRKASPAKKKPSAKRPRTKRKTTPSQLTKRNQQKRQKK